MSDPESMELAQVFNPPFILNSSLISKTIRESMIKMKKKILLFEGGMANDIEEMIVEEGLNGAKRIIAHLGMRNYKIDIAKDREPIILKESKWLRAPNSGMFQALVKNGALVEKGETLAIVTDPYGNYEKKIKASSPGYIICVNKSPVVYKGDAILHIARATE
jgi:predicted deacylase